MSAKLIIGDSLTVLRSLPDASVDLVLTSPPFLALRSYLPADHPDKAHEVGAEPNPAAFIDSLLDVTEECRRVLRPTGSLCFELGDTYAGSGGAGGDYNDGGMRAGQPKFRAIQPNESMRFNGDGSVKTDRAKRRQEPKNVRGPMPLNAGNGWPLDKSLCLIPESYRWALVYGRNPFNGRLTPQWRARNVVRWCRPNPPVGQLHDKFRPATSDMVVACMERARWFDLDAVRNAPNDRTDKWPGGRAAKLNPGEEPYERHSGSNPAGAPPLDWWEISTRPYAGSHYATWPPALLIKPILAMCPPNGTVLDPFAGSGTTLAVATGHGRDAIGIDLDERNADLARERVGMFLTVEHFKAEASA